MFNLQQTIDAVQTNCDIADARHARDMSMCNYLLAMRDYYRWKKQIPFSHQLKKSEVASWLNKCETKWNEVEENEYLPIPVAGYEHDYLDTKAINQALKGYGLIYGSGFGSWGRPLFFLAQMVRREQRFNVSILVSGNEYARCMAAPPAALNRGTVFMRMDAMERWLSGKVEIWGLSKTDKTLKAFLDCYGIGDTDESKLKIIAFQESETLILHELGEAMAEPLLGDAWHKMLSSLSLRRYEFLARAVRDNLADCLSTLPELIEGDKICSLHFYFSNFDGLRQSLFPSLLKAYECWCKNNDVAALHNAIAAGRLHWQNVARNILAAWTDNPATAEIIFGSYGENFSKLML